MATQSKLLSFAIVCIVGIAGVAASLPWRHPAASVESNEGSLLSPSRALPDFSLIDRLGRGFGTGALRARRPLLFFVCTNCPDFRPTTLAATAASA